MLLQSPITTQQYEQGVQPYSYDSYASNIPTTSRVPPGAPIALLSIVPTTNDLDRLHYQVRELEIELALRKAATRAPLPRGYHSIEEAQQAHRRQFGVDIF